MKIVDFADLAIADQLELLYVDGIYLSKRRQGFTPVILYQFEKLYVEIYYTRYRSIVRKIVCSQSTDILYPYLSQINIDDVFDSF